MIEDVCGCMWGVGVENIISWFWLIYCIHFVSSRIGEVWETINRLYTIDEGTIEIGNDEELGRRGFRLRNKKMIVKTFFFIPPYPSFLYISRVDAQSWTRSWATKRGVRVHFDCAILGHGMVNHLCSIFDPYLLKIRVFYYI